MKVRSEAIILAVATLALPAAFAQSAMAAEPPQQQGAQTNVPATYYWLHPKLGMVKVERATGFMVVSRRQQQAQTIQEPKGGHDHSRVHKLM